MDAEGNVGYEARYGWNARSGRAIGISALFVVVGIFAPMSLAFRVLILAFFGGGGALLLGIVCSRRLALRVDAQGITLGGVPPRYRQKTVTVPWADIEKVVLWKQALSYGQSMPYVGLVRRPEAPALAGPKGQQVARGVAGVFHVPVSAETLSASRAVNGWRLDKPRFVAAVKSFAPDVPLDDNW